MGKPEHPSVANWRRPIPGEDPDDKPLSLLAKMRGNTAFPKHVLRYFKDYPARSFISDESRAMKMRSSTGSISQARSAVLPPASAMQKNASAIRGQWRQMKSRTSRRTSTDERAPCCGINVLSRMGSRRQC